MVQDLRRHSIKKRKPERRARSVNLGFFGSIITSVLKIFLFIFGFLFKMLRSFFYALEGRVGRFFFVQSVFFITIALILINLWGVFSMGGETGRDTFLSSLKIIPAKRGNIYYRNIKFNKTIALTSSERSSKITYDPSFLATNVEKNIFNLNDIIFGLSSQLNIPYQEVENTIKNDVQANTKSRYAILKNDASNEQGEAVNTMRISKSPLQYNLWLTYEPVETRVYPEGKTLSYVVGYSEKYKTIRDEVWQVQECRQMILDNEKRSTVDSFSGRKEDGVYTRGIYGLERNYCSELGGLNGREQVVADGRNKSNGLIQDGSDLYLTIDSTLQAKAEEILAKSIESNNYGEAKPRNGSIIVMNLEDWGSLKAGEILAMASSPNGDPNNYGSNNYIANGGFNNVNVSDAYEVGSVMKPITMASALNEWYNNSTNKLGERIGLNPDWQFVTYGPNGKTYTEQGGATYSIHNADGLWNFSRTQNPYDPIHIKDCLYLSINTCFADIELRISNSEEEIKNNVYYRHTTTENYYTERYGLGKPTLADTFPATTGDISNFKSNVSNTFQYANFSFGQGFNITPMQLVRAYTPFARLDGKMVEPFLVKSIHHEDGTIENATDSNNPKIAVGKPVQVLNPEVSKKMNEYMRHVQQEHQTEVRLRGQNGEYRGVVTDYPMGSKTGTAQVSRPDTSAVLAGKCFSGESYIDCNTRNGIYDESYIHFGPIGSQYEGKYPKIIVFYKMSEAKPGLEKNNYSIFHLGPWIAEMSRFTLDYLGVPANLPPPQ